MARLKVADGPMRSERLGIDWTFEDMVTDARQRIARGTNYLDAAYGAFVSVVVSGHGDDWVRLVAAVKPK